MIIRCPKCNNQFKPIKFRTAPDGSTLVECLTCQFAFPFPEDATESAEKQPIPSSGTEQSASAQEEIPKVEFVDPKLVPEETPLEPAQETTPAGTTETEITQEILPSGIQDTGEPAADAEIQDFFKPHKVRERKEGQKYKLMIVDDTAFFRKVLSDIFEENGYEVITAVDGVDGIKKIKEEQDDLDLLLLDLQLPKMSGFEVLDSLRQSGISENFPTIVITGIHQKSEEIRLVKQLGATGYISKANTPEYFLFRVNQILNPSEAKWVEPEQE